MASAQVLQSISIILISFIVGLIFFNMISSLSKDERKQQIEEMTSQLINFVIFIWIGKVILNIKLFISDPLAVLAYPSNSNAFYLATFFIALNIIYKIKKHQLDGTKLLTSFIPVFLVASFVNEFIEIVWNGNTYSWSYLSLLMVLLVVLMVLQDKIPYSDVTMYLLLAWSVGKLVLAIWLPFTTIFGYIISPLFIIILIVLIILVIFNFRKKVS